MIHHAPLLKTDMSYRGRRNQVVAFEEAGNGWNMGNTTKIW